MGNHRYEVRMGFGFGFGVPRASKIPLVGKYLGASITEYIIEDTISHAKALYEFVSVDGSKGLLPVTLNIASSASAFDSELNLNQFAGKVLIKGAATGERSLFSSMIWLDGPAKGLNVSTSGWQISVPGAGGSTGMLVLRDVSLPATVAWDRALYAINIWRLALDLPGNYIKDGIVEHWGAFTIDATQSKNWLSSVPTFNWEWAATKSVKAYHLPDWLRVSRRGTLDPMEANDKLILHDGVVSGPIFSDLIGGGAIMDNAGVSVVPNNGQGVHWMVGKPSNVGGIGVAGDTRHNGNIYNGAVRNPIIWILTKRDVASK